MYSMDALCTIVCVVQVEIKWCINLWPKSNNEQSFMNVNYSQIQTLIYIQLEKQGDWGGMSVELQVK